MIKELQKLTKEQLLTLTKHFEYYPAVTDSDDIGYILAYLEDESCEINHNEIIEYLYKEVKLEITQENLHLYYKFMNDEDLIQNSEILNDLLVCRFHKICSLLSVSAPMLHSYSSYNYYNAFFVKQFIFGIKDNLNPIEDFIEDIKNSNEYKTFILKAS